VCVVLILLGREKGKRECVCCIDIIGEREEQETSVCFVLILLGREQSKMECVCCIDIIGEREEQESVPVCVLY